MPTVLPARRRPAPDPIWEDAVYLLVSCAALIALYALALTSYYRAVPDSTGPLPGYEETFPALGEFNSPI